MGRTVLGKWGMLAGGGLGYWLAPEGGTEQPPRAAAVTGGAEEIEAQVRYPEETIIDAMAKDEDAEETARQQEDIRG